MDMAVTAVSNLGRNGTSDWVIQRISAVVLLAYTLFLVGYLLLHPDINYLQWKALFSLTCIRIFSLAALLSLVAHGWIGMWGIATDYLTERLLGPKGNVLRWLFLLACGVLTFVYLFWGIQILWGN